jgi:nucleotide-binding universal stress UspA family protein
MPARKIILAATDFSETATSAVAQAFELAALQGSKVHLIHAYSVPGYPDGFALGVDVVGPLEQAAKRALGLEKEKYGSRPEFGGAILEMGDARDVILQHAKSLPADLIVVGTHGRRGFQHLLLGSVAEAIARRAACPVLIVPTARKRA